MFQVPFTHLLPHSPWPASLADLPQRLKGAIDSRIAEEQARVANAAKAAGPPVTKTASRARRSNTLPESPGLKSKRPRPKDNEVSTVRGPDPAEFENAFVIDDDSEEASRVGTLSISEETASTMAESTPRTSISGDGGEKGGDSTADAPATPTQVELPVEVRKQLRKLEKMETRYAGKLY